MFNNRMLMAAMALPLLASCARMAPMIQPVMMPGVLPATSAIQSSNEPWQNNGLHNVIGRVYDENNMPMAGNSVFCKMLDPNDHFANGENTYTAVIDQGDFGLANLKAPCSFTTTVDIPGYVKQTKRFDLTPSMPVVVRGPIFYLQKQAGHH